MSSSYESVLSEFEEFPSTNGPWTRTVYRRGSGPAVIIIHEVPGLHPLVLRYANRVAEAGMTVFLPSLFGKPGKPVTLAYSLRSLAENICIRREFHVWSTGRSSPIVAWLRALATKCHSDCGGLGVGAVGMCFTGGFALAMMTEPSVIAPVLSQPALSFRAWSAERAASIGVSREEIACVRQRLNNEGLSILGLRFKGDAAVPDARFRTYEREFKAHFEAIELNAADALASWHPPHSVLTGNLREYGPTKAAEQRTISFLKERTGA